MGPTWVLLAPSGPHVGPMNLAIRGVAGKQWSGVQHTTCYSSGWSTYYYNCHCLNQNMILLSYIRVFPSIWSEKNVCFDLSFSRYFCLFFHVNGDIHSVYPIDMYRDKISVHHDAPVNHYTHSARPSAATLTLNRLFPDYNHAANRSCYGH